MSDISDSATPPVAAVPVLPAPLRGGHDQNTPQITSIRLDDSNYLSWSRSITLALKSRRLFGYVTGQVPAPATSSPEWLTWDSENSLVMSWLTNSMQEALARNYLFLDTAADIWRRAEATYSRRGNAAQIFQLRRRISLLRQSDRPPSVYYLEFTQLYQEYDHFDPLVFTSPVDEAMVRAREERNRIFEFLHGLHRDFDQISVQILGRTLLPSLPEVYSLVQQEFDRRQSLVPDSLPESSALVAGSSILGVRPPRDAKMRGPDKDHLVCDYCGKNRHTRDTCFRLHGFPPPRGGATRGGRGSGRTSSRHTVLRSAHLTDASVDVSSGPDPYAVTGSFSAEEMLALRRMMQGLTTEPTALSSSTYAHTGTPGAHSAESMTSPQWIIDSGATDHMTGSASGFVSYTPLSGRDKVSIADGSLSSIAGKGSISCSSLLLSSVLHVPSFTRNLLSISHLTNSMNCSVTFLPSSCVFQDLTTGKVIGSGSLVNGLYVLDSGTATPPRALLSASSHPLYSQHCRLGHPSISVMRLLFPHVSTTVLNSFLCDVCATSKHKRHAFSHVSLPSSVPFSVIHTDVWGPYPVQSISGCAWFVSFIDCFSRTTWLYLLKNKNDVFPTFQRFHKMVSTQFHTNIQILRSDNGREYIDSHFSHYLADHGILHQTTCPYSPAQNGVAERKNRHLLEVARCLLSTMHLPKYYWGDAVLTAAYLINRMPTPVLGNDTPLGALHLTPSTLPPKVFGCVCFVHIHHPRPSKLDPRALRCVFIGYSATQKGYKCFHPPTRKVFVSMDVTFHEDESYYAPTADTTSAPPPTTPSPTTPLPVPPPYYPSLQGESLPREVSSYVPPPPICPGVPSLQVYSRRSKGPSTQDHAIRPDQSLDPESGSPDAPIALRKGIRSCTKHPLSNYVSYDSFSTAYKTFISSLASITIPSSWQEAIGIPEWKGAMLEEMMALEKNHTWDLVQLPFGKKTVGCKWVFTVKQNPQGVIERCKARLVARGYTQTFGVDYQETFAPVAKMNTIRVLLSCAACKGWDLCQLDVKNAFLHGNLDEEVYMTLPPGLISSGSEGKVCKLKKALYGLKQSPRAWFGRFHKAMVSFGYHQSNADHTLFIKKRATQLTILIVYVDDIVITGDDVEEIKILKQKLASEFEVKDLGKLRYFLGIEVARSNHGIFISQRKYTLDLLEKTGMSGCKPVNTPIEANHKLGKDGKCIDDVPAFQRLVGRLIYLSHTRPDISYAVGVISQFMHAPKTNHVDAAHRILRYLKSSPGRGILFSPNSCLDIEVYTDADWAGSIDDRRSTSGYCSLIGGNLVTWRSKKQQVVARSSAEAEFRAMAHGVCEGLWLRSLMSDLGLVEEAPIRLYCDNKAAISIAHNPVQHDRTKHIEVDRHFIKENIEKGVVCTPFVPSERQLADILTKGLHGSNFDRIVIKLGMINISRPT
ncbi:hypothetical protein KSP39_PZI019078 [Platanthera zijinensis]|uniref:Integrase catalytic domain-containing protein n=1 Tax=Platanthera zijinensis TaxID=2320716 RepID=A0AAP0B291_9ASPA